jgi:hypothetical protein
MFFVEKRMEIDIVGFKEREIRLRNEFIVIGDCYKRGTATRDEFLSAHADWCEAKGICRLMERVKGIG